MYRRLTKFILLFQCIFSSFYCEATALDLTNEVRYFFKDVLLIINFNHPYYQNIEFLKEIYGPYFGNIVFYGEEKNPDYPEVQVIDHHYGWFVHRTINDAMERWPGYKGYICCQDDCFMNFWNFLRFDKNKIWMHPYSTAPLEDPGISWTWWGCWCGQPAAIQAYKKLSPRQIATLEQNCGPFRFAVAWADFAYIPGKYRKNFLKVSRCLDNPPVFIEIAIPTITLALESYENMEHTNPCWGGSITSVGVENYSKDYDWTHPLKLSVPENREFIRNILENVFSK